MQKRKFMLQISGRPFMNIAEVTQLDFNKITESY